MKFALETVRACLHASGGRRAAQARSAQRRRSGRLNTLIAARANTIVTARGRAEWLRLSRQPAAGSTQTNGISAANSAGHVRQLVAPHGDAISRLALSPDGSRLAWLQTRSAGEDTKAWDSGFTCAGLSRLIVAVLTVGAGEVPGSSPTYRSNGVSGSAISPSG